MSGLCARYVARARRECAIPTHSFIMCGWSGVLSKLCGSSATSYDRDSRTMHIARTKGKLRRNAPVPRCQHREGPVSKYCSGSEAARKSKVSTSISVFVSSIHATSETFSNMALDALDSAFGVADSRRVVGWRKHLFGYEYQVWSVRHVGVSFAALL